MTIADIIQVVVSFFLGGGLSTFFSLKYLRKENKRKDLTGDFEALRNVIAGQQDEIEKLQKKLTTTATLWETYCKECSYRVFVLKQEKRLNEKITQRNSQIDN